HRVEIVRLDGTDAAGAAPDGAIVHATAGNDAPVAIARALSRNPDVVHIATPGPLGPHVIEVLSRVPTIVDVHGHWPACPRNDLMRQPFDVPCELTFPADACASCAGLDRLREMDARQRLLARATAIVTHSSFHAGQIAAFYERGVDQVSYGV